MSMNNGPSRMGRLVEALAHMISAATPGERSPSEPEASFQEASFDGDLNFKSASISTILLEKARYGKSSRLILNDTDFARSRFTGMRSRSMWSGSRPLIWPW